MEPTSLDRKVSDFTVTDFVKVPPGTKVSQAAKEMKAKGASEAVVFGGSEAIGILTERDILYKVVAEGRDPSKTPVDDVMTAPIQVIEDDARVGEAIAKMARAGARRLGVTHKGKIFGLITQKVVLSGTSVEHAVLPELASPGKVVCPYCDAILSGPDELSKHIDDVHVGRGLLQGDVTKW
jgi:signal-transduction protein with cAMP-binding, CBS, and nucleotidyltransferase domain